MCACMHIYEHECVLCLPPDALMEVEVGDCLNLSFMVEGLSSQFKYKSISLDAI